MKVIIETGRLILREFTREDAELVLQLNRDPEVIRYTGDPIEDMDHAMQVLEQSILPQYALYRHGRWAVHIKLTGEFIGWCGLKARPERNEIDLGYRFVKSSWGNGYATEAATACLRYGFEVLGLPRVVGRAVLANLPSIAVLEKCGMHYLCEEVVDGHLAKTYEIIHPTSR